MRKGFLIHMMAGFFVNAVITVLGGPPWAAVGAGLAVFIVLDALDKSK